MAKPGLGNITTGQTFQNWFDKTNELVNIFKTDAITASGSGDTTTGNAILVGNFTATTLTGNISTDSIAVASAGGTIDFTSPVQFNGTSNICATFNFGTGGRTRYQAGTLTWDTGIEDTSGGSFIIDTGVGQRKFELTPAGTLIVPDIIANTITADTITADNIDLSALTSDDVSEGSTNLYFTAARARSSFSGGDGINIASNGVISMDGDGILTSVQANDFKLAGAAGASTAATINGTVIAGGFPQGRLVTTYGGSTTPILTWSPTAVSSAVDLNVTGDMTVAGNIRATGDLITAYSASDIKLKENLQIINNALDKVTQINGYTFNYKISPSERVAGVVAQEIEKVLPEVVYETTGIYDNETYKGVRYGNMIPLLLEAIKELKGKVDDLEARLRNSDK